MGIGNRARRAAKRRRRERGRAPVPTRRTRRAGEAARGSAAPPTDTPPTDGRSGAGPAAGPTASSGPFRTSSGDEGARRRGPSAAERERALSVALWEACVLAEADPRSVRWSAQRLLAADGPAGGPGPVAAAVTALARSLVAGVVRCGWTPGDLGQVTRRRLGADHVAPLAAWLADEAAAHPHDGVAPAWRDDLLALGRPVPCLPGRVGGLSRAIGLLGLLSALPKIAEVLPPPGRAQATGTASRDGSGTPSRATTHADSRLLTRVRSLLAKAESTAFPEEAEALSAKAQELVSRHQLEEMLAEAQRGDTTSTVLPRRLWLDPPYVLPKALLVQAVAEANHCSAVASVDVGFTTLVGEPRSLDTVELLATSLLLQADAAMLQHGRSTDRWGGSRTTSFRRAFLVSYATRIGERFRAAAHVAAAGTGSSRALVPLLVRHDERVRGVRDQLFTRIEAKGTTVSNGAGWAAGRAAADGARLGPDRPAVDRAG